MAEQDVAAGTENAQATLPLAEGGAASTGSAEQATAGTTATETPSQSAAPASLPSYMGGRFKSVEQLEAYTQGLERQQHQPAQTAQQSTSQSQTYTPDQLKASKQHWLNEHVAAQVRGDATAAAQALQNHAWCDDKLADVRLSNESKRWQGQSAVDSLMREGNELVKPYMNDLQPGNPLFETANQYFGQMKAAHEAGVPLDNILQGLAIIAAAQKTGRTTQGVKQQATQQFADAVNKAAKSAVITGGGQASKTSTGKVDYANMSKEDFAKAFAANSGGKSLY